MRVLTLGINFKLGYVNCERSRRGTQMSIHTLYCAGTGDAAQAASASEVPRAIDRVHKEALAQEMKILSDAVAA